MDKATRDELTAAALKTRDEYQFMARKAEPDSASAASILNAIADSWEEFAHQLYMKGLEI